jgi:REP element-mobilizing transposase RayT
MRTARAKVEGFAFYHVMNRVLERRYILTGEVAEQFRLLMRKVEAFTGVQVVTYCLMSNHVHLLLKVPDRKELSDEEMLRRLALLSSRSAYAQFMDKWNRLMEQQSESGLRELRQSVLARMFDLSGFMKELKQRFSLWYNRRDQRQGTIWEDRFKSTLIENKPGYLATAAAYIDNNPVRAGWVSDAKEHRFCGYAEALAGSAAALAGLEILTQALHVQGDAQAVLARYRVLLYGKGAATEERAGYSTDAIAQVEQADGQLAPWTLTGHRLRWLSDGAVIGSQAFVQELRVRLREKLGLRRRQGAYPVAEATDLHALKALRSG